MISDAAREEQSRDGLRALELLGKERYFCGVYGWEYPLLRPSVGGGHGSLLVAVAVVDDDATEVGDSLHQVLKAVVPVGGDLEEEHDSLVREA